VNAWGWYWTSWFTVSVAAFLGPELYSLATKNGQSLSQKVWDLEQASPGAPIWQWSALHYLIAALLAALLIWLLFHLTFDIWR
jgi:hypothetical protein